MSNKKSTKGRQKPAFSGDVVSELLDMDANKPEGPAGDDGLTEKQRAFVVAYTRGETAGNSTKSAEIAGYSKKTSQQIGSNLMKLPHIVLAIEMALRVEIGTTLTVQSVAYLGRVLNDEAAPQKLRAGIALRLAESSGVLERVKIEKGKQTGLSGDKSLMELDRSELEMLVRQGAEVLKAAAALPPPGAVIEGHAAQHSAPPALSAAE